MYDTAIASIDSNITPPEPNTQEYLNTSMFRGTCDSPPFLSCDRAGDCSRTVT